MKGIVYLIIVCIFGILLQIIDFPKWKVSSRVGTSIVFFIIIIIAVVNLVSDYKAGQQEKKDRKTLEDVKTILVELRKKADLTLYLDDIKIETLKHHVAKHEFEKLMINIKKFNEGLENKNKIVLRDSMHEIIRIIPTDPFFRIYRYAVDDNLIDKVFSGEMKVVKVISWEHDLEGEEDFGLYIHTTDGTKENSKIYGPFVDNKCTIIDVPLERYLSVQIKSVGTGRFTYYPRSFRIGWALAINENGKWAISKNHIEYDPFIRLDLHGLIEW